MRLRGDTLSWRLPSDSADTASRPEAPSVCPRLPGASSGGFPYPRIGRDRPCRWQRFFPGQPASDVAIALRR